MLFDPLKYYYKKIGCNHNLIAEIVTGEKYIAVMLKNGQIGVCSTLNHPLEKIETCFRPDFSCISHRIVYNAYLNAILNYKNDYSENRDIFDKINFKKYSKIVMIGFFKSLFAKFEKAGIEVVVFDKAETSDYLTDMSKQKESLQNCDAAIITGTSIFNRTFGKLLNSTSTEADIFVLGPSTILDPDMFKKTDIKTLFGAQFEPNDKLVLNIIKEGGGTPAFVDKMQKVYLYRPS